MCGVGVDVRNCVHYGGIAIIRADKSVAKDNQCQFIIQLSLKSGTDIRVTYIDGKTLRQESKVTEDTTTIKSDKRVFCNVN